MMDNSVFSRIIVKHGDITKRTLTQLSTQQILLCSEEEAWTERYTVLPVLNF